MNRSVRKKQRGVSLVESMIALLVLSIGMLGIAGLYVESLRSGKSALLRTQAVLLATDMAERIRANATAGASYIKTEGYAGALTAGCSTAASPCTPAQLALNDIFVWNSLVDDRNDNPAAGQLGLPQGRGIISMDSATPRIYRITIQWQEIGQATPSSYVILVQA